MGPHAGGQYCRSREVRVEATRWPTVRHFDSPDPTAGGDNPQMDRSAGSTCGQLVPGTGRHEGISEPFPGAFQVAGRSDALEYPVDATQQPSYSDPASVTVKPPLLAAHELRGQQLERQQALLRQQVGAADVGKQPPCEPRSEDPDDADPVSAPAPLAGYRADGTDQPPCVACGAPALAPWA